MKHNQFIVSLATLLTLAITGCREKTTTEKVPKQIADTLMKINTPETPRNPIPVRSIGFSCDDPD